MKIKVVTYMWGDFKYFALSEKINRMYCERHGYEYVIGRTRPREDSHPAWGKLPVILNEMHDCDYLLYVDADAVFYSHGLRIEDELIPDLRDKVLMMASDCARDGYRVRATLPNTGVILIKVCDKAKVLFEEWNTLPDVDPSMRYADFWEQSAYHKHLMDKYRDILHLNVDYYRMNGLFGQYIRHFLAQSDDARVVRMQRVYNRLMQVGC